MSPGNEGDKGPALMAVTVRLGDDNTQRSQVKRTQAPFPSRCQTGFQAKDLLLLQPVTGEGHKEANIPTVTAREEAEEEAGFTMRTGPQQP